MDAFWVQGMERFKRTMPEINALNVNNELEISQELSNKLPGRLIVGIISTCMEYLRFKLEAV